MFATCDKLPVLPGDIFWSGNLNKSIRCFLIRCKISTLEVFLILFLLILFDSTNNIFMSLFVLAAMFFSFISVNTFFEFFSFEKNQTGLILIKLDIKKSKNEPVLYLFFNQTLKIENLEWENGIWRKFVFSFTCGNLNQCFFSGLLLIWYTNALELICG